MPGPADRESFFAAQRRHRWASWWYAASCMLAALILAIVASIVLSPFVILLEALAVRLLSIGVPIPGVVWDGFRLLLAMFGELRSALQDGRLSPNEVVPSLESLGVLLIPGVVAIFGLWLVIWTLMVRAGIGGILLTLGARPPSPNELEERQLVDVVQEMAIAAGLPPPRVMLVDADVANAAAVGSSLHDATVVVSRRLLDELDRDETQGVLGHLIASIGNGDLRILMTFLTVAQTFGLLMALLDVPMSVRARDTIWRMLTLALFGWTRRAGPDPEAELVRTALIGSLGPGAMQDTLEPLDATDRPSINPLHRALLTVRFFLLIPLILVSLEAKLLLLLFSLLVIGPLSWWTLRTRRYLADATAVQLTRNPDGLARALIALAGSGDTNLSGQWAGPLCVVGDARSRATGLAFVSTRLRPRSPSSLPGRRANPRGELAAPQSRDRRGPAANKIRALDDSLFLLGAQPPLRGRMARLRALGASIQPVADSTPGGRVSRPAAAAPTKALSKPLELLVAVPLVVGLVVVAGLVIFYGASMFLYLFAVGVFGALFVVAGFYVLVMELVLRLLSWGG